MEDKPIVTIPDNKIIDTSDLPASEVLAVETLQDKHDSEIRQEENERQYNQETHNQLWDKLRELEQEITTLKLKSSVSTAEQVPESTVETVKTAAEQVPEVVQLEPVPVDVADPGKTKRTRRTFIF